jgi:hypothetical protein
MKKMQLTKEGVVYAFTLVAQGITMLLPRTYDNQLFQSAPQIDALPRRIFALDGQAGAEPSADGHADGHDDSGKAGKAGKQGKAAKTGKPHGRLMKVIAVGPANLTAASVRSGRVSTVLLQSGSKIARSDGARLTWEEALAQMTEGDLIRVKGKRDHTRNIIPVRRMTLLGSALAAAAAPLGG